MKTPEEPNTLNAEAGETDKRQGELGDEILNEVSGGVRGTTDENENSWFLGGRVK